MVLAIRLNSSFFRRTCINSDTLFLIKASAVVTKQLYFIIKDDLQTLFSSQLKPPHAINSPDCSGIPRFWGVDTAKSG